MCVAVVVCGIVRVVELMCGCACTCLVQLYSSVLLYCTSALPHLCTSAPLHLRCPAPALLLLCTSALLLCTAALLCTSAPLHIHTPKTPHYSTPTTHHVPPTPHSCSLTTNQDIPCEALYMQLLYTLDVFVVLDSIKDAKVQSG